MKLVNHIDHVAWVFRPDSIERNVAMFSRMFDITFDGPVHKPDFGFTVYLSWEAGIEIVCAHETRTDFNRHLHDHLDAHGEGLMSIVWGVRDIEQTKQRLEADGFDVGELWGNDPQSPWREKVSIKERDLGTHMNTRIILGEIDYAEGVLTID